MKRLRIFALCIVHCALCTTLSAREVPEVEPALVYHFPFTSIYLDVEYEVCEQQAGPLAEYASMLGITDAVTSTDTLYRFVSVATGTQTTPDSTRTVRVLPKKGFAPQLLALDRRGILAGYNVVIDEDKPAEPKKAKARTRRETPEAMPLSEEALHRTGAKRAEAVRQQILHLREARTFLLLGESESQPADGRQLELLLHSIHEEEMALTALFTGSRSYRTEYRRICFIPTVSTDSVLCRFSEAEGIVPADAEGTPLHITTIVSHAELPTPGEKDRVAPMSSVMYNLPGSCDYTLFFGDELLHKRSIDVAQFGVAVPLALELLTPETHILFNTRTGNIQSVTR